ncbi:MAG: ADP-dependent glucokinase/phosphofructokinase [Halapricum sp.]
MTAVDTEPKDALDAIAAYPIFLAHNANVDALVHVDETLEAVLDPPGEDWPDSVDSPQALSTALTRTMARGTGDLLSTSDGFDVWMDEHLVPDEQRLGGQAAIMADLVSLLDGDAVFWTYLLSATQRAQFSRPEAIRFPTVEDGELRFVPLSAAPTSERTKRNWIFEFSTGDRLFETTATADTRFIAATRPDRFNLETGLDPVVEQLGEAVECALLSGYQSLKHTYDDGSTFREHVDRGAQFLRKLADQGVTIQLEYGVTHKRDLRRAIIEEVLPEVHAIGMDARELELLCEDLAHEGGGPGPEIVARYRTLRDLLPILGVDCIKVHTTNYFLAVMDDYLDPEHVAEGWAMAAIVAASKAAEGVIDEPADLQTGLEYDFAAPGLASIDDLGSYVGVADPGPSLVAEHDDVEIAAHANRVVADPVSTVGLGDSIAVTNFLLENALQENERD